MEILQRRRRSPALGPVDRREDKPEVSFALALRVELQQI
jgi:hypothetical protein